MMNPRRLKIARFLYTMLHSVHMGMQLPALSGAHGLQWPFSRAVIRWAFLKLRWPSLEPQQAQRWSYARFSFMKSSAPSA